VANGLCLAEKIYMFTIRESRIFMMLAALWLASGSQSAAQADTFTDHGTTLTTLHSFDGTDGRLSFAGLVQATNGNLYGTTYYGGAKNSGEVFEITSDGTLTTLHSFCSKSGCTDGEYTYAVPIQGADGSFYGTTYLGGSKELGTVFKINPSGTATTLHSFEGKDGSQPLAGLVQAANGDFYGTTYLGGSEDDGTIFKITPSGAFTTLHSFCSQSECTDGENPFARLVQGIDGNLYGTTLGGGGSKGFGTVFKITQSGTLTTLHSFCAQSGCPDGQFPQTGLVQANNGNFYGTTISGGAYGDGTIFEITPSGKLTTLYSVCSQSGCPDGNYLYAELIQATDGNLYGIMDVGGANGAGTIFKITMSGTLTTLYNFCSQSGCPDGQYPSAGLVQGTDGNLYGTTADGGTNGDGTVFRLSVGLGPFVETEPTAAKVGATVRILGTNLTGTTSVNFNGKAATFTVVSSSEISTTVPSGATTGEVRVITQGGTLSSNVSFRVSP
jgi:uncharacterized repeat protein (TIGR03803 family)